MGKKKRRMDTDDVHDGSLVEIEVVSPTEVVLWVLTNAHWTGGQSWRVGARIAKIGNPDEARAWLRGLTPDARGSLGGVLGIAQCDGYVSVGLIEGDFRFVGARLSTV